ncbi:hypothetical protein GCM10027610_104460 [Dactylosporangium cerinum]
MQRLEGTSAGDNAVHVIVTADVVPPQSRGDYEALPCEPFGVLQGLLAFSEIVDDVEDVGEQDDVRR